MEVAKRHRVRNILKNRMHHICAIGFLFFMTSFLMLLNIRPVSRSVPKKLLAILTDEESLIDWKLKDQTAYTLIHRNGPEKVTDLFVLFSKTPEGGWMRSYENDFEGLKPWKIETADIDGDKDEEILIAVKKTTKFDPAERNRMFVFNFTDGALVKKWTGSQIAGDWEDFYTENLISTPGEELIFISRGQDGQKKTSVYGWFDFGFILLSKPEEE